MELVPSQIIVGIDVSKQSVDVATSLARSCRTYPNTPTGFARVVADLVSFPNVLIVLEATGEYHIPLVEALEAAGHLTAICNPARVRHFARGMGLRSKTDRVDAQVLVAFGQSRQPMARPLLHPVLRHLQALLARRDNLVKTRTMESNRREATHDQIIAASLAEMIAYVSGQIRTFDRAIATLIAGDTVLQARSALLRTVPGIGPLVAARCLVCLPELGTMTAKQLAALVGVAPYARDSGQFRGKRFIQGGKAPIRQALYQAVTSAVMCTRNANLLKDHYHHLRERGKPHNLAMVATIRRLLTYLTVMTRDHMT